ncbi:MAG: hypothetical protein JWN22_3890 [Nocardioides sp.]|jgi:hypothetical protein|nr:hypothetical protein [Nocardioides sp.]
MRTRTRLGLVTGVAVLATSLIPIGAASAGVRESWEYDAHAAGMPAGDEPARTLQTARAQFSYTSTADGAVEATVTLGAEPTAATDAELHLVLGVSLETGCEPGWEHSLSTFATGTGGTRDGAVIQFGVDAPPYDAQRDCSYVELRERGDPSIVLDRLEGRWAGGVITEPPDGLTLRAPAAARVQRGNWSGVRLRVNTYDAVTRVVIRGQGHNLLTRDVVLDGEEIVARGYTVTFLPVKLLDKGARRVRIQAVAFGQDGEQLGGGLQWVRLRPR